jgi:hypothetical protein
MEKGDISFFGVFGHLVAMVTVFIYTVFKWGAVPLLIFFWLVADNQGV